MMVTLTRGQRILISLMHWLEALEKSRTISQKVPLVVKPVVGVVEDVIRHVVPVILQKLLLRMSSHCVDRCELHLSLSL